MYTVLLAATPIQRDSAEKKINANFYKLFFFSLFRCSSAFLDVFLVSSCDVYTSGKVGKVPTW